MGHFWNAKIETKIARNKSFKERRVFYIRINGMSEAHNNAPFKIKTQRNVELFSTKASEFLRNLYSNTFGNGAELEQYWRCAYHGRTKGISLYVIGCDKFNGLLILDDNLYSIMPVLEMNQETVRFYRLDLLNPTVKFATSSINEANNTFTNYNNSQRQSLLNSRLDTARTDPLVSVNLNIDKSYFTEFLLTNSQLMHTYFRNMVIQSHLTWAYYHHEHRLNLQFNAISYIDIRRAHKKTRLFNIDPMELVGYQDQYVYSLENIYHSLYNKEELPDNQLNIYLIPSLVLTTSEASSLNGLASFGTKAPNYCNKPVPTKSLILLKEPHLEHLNSNLIKPEPARFLTLAIEQANTLIDLIGYNMGSANTFSSSPTCKHMANDEFNWYFQTPATSASLLDNQSDEDTAMASTNNNEYNIESDVCLKKVVQFETDCGRIHFSKNVCGDGIVDGEEQCDCDRSDANCTKCCDMDTCQFRSSKVQCAVGKCCDNQCQIMSKSTVCRRSNDIDSTNHISCDWPEFCDGTSYECPADEFAHNGSPCDSTNQSYCWLGKCVTTRDEQCDVHWRGRSSDQSCYDNFNTIGFQNGNCGRNGSHKFLPCLPADAQCGLLNCQLGYETPLSDSESFFKATTNTRGNINECKVITSPSVYVADGSRCQLPDVNDKEGLCINQKCVARDSILNFNSNKCTLHGKLCSNNGVCDNQEKCHCNLGWEGHFCEFKQPDTASNLINPSHNLNNQVHRQVLSSSNSITFKTNTLVSILLSIGVLTTVIFFALLLLYCKRRSRRMSKRSKQHRNKGHLDAMDGPFSDCQKSDTLLSLAESQDLPAMPLCTNHDPDQSLSSLSQNLSLSQVNHAINQLKTQPSKSILKKKTSSHSLKTTAASQQAPALSETQCKHHQTQQQKHKKRLDDSLNDSAVKFERQVNINTMLNSAIGAGHRISRRSMMRGQRCVKSKDLNDDDSNSSSSSVESNHSSSDQSISSNLSNELEQNQKQCCQQKLPDLSFLTSSSSSTANSSRRESITSSSSLQALEAPALDADILQQKLDKDQDFCKVQDYLNELNILSKQNNFQASDAKSPERPQSLITPVRKYPSNHQFTQDDRSQPNQRLSQILADSALASNGNGFNAGQQMLLQLQILKSKGVNSPDDLVNLYTNSSETSSGYMSNSIQNLNQCSAGVKQPQVVMKSPNDSSYNSPTSCSVTPPMPTCLQEEMNQSQADLV